MIFLTSGTFILNDLFSPFKSTFFSTIYLFIDNCVYNFNTVYLFFLLINFIVMLPLKQTTPGHMPICVFLNTTLVNHLNMYNIKYINV